MGRLIEDVTEDRATLEEETKRLVKKLIGDARDAIEYHGCLPNPVAAAIIGSQVHLWPLWWKDDKDKSRLFKKLNTYLDDMNATSVVFIFQKKSELFIAVETPQGRRLSIIPFKATSDDVEWGTPRHARTFTTQLHGPCVN